MSKLLHRTCPQQLFSHLFPLYWSHAEQAPIIPLTTHRSFLSAVQWS